MNPNQLHDSELIHYASLSDDPEKRRLAEIAARAEPWARLRCHVTGIETPEDVNGLVERGHDCRAALRDIDGLTAESAPDTEYLQYLARLSQAADAGRVQLVEDCPTCDGDGLNPDSPDPFSRCPDCKGRGVILQPADSDSI